jgi:hypothetical protein
MSADLPSWIQALAALSLVILTFLTLIVLRKYAADTKKIANISFMQVEPIVKGGVLAAHADIADAFSLRQRLVIRYESPFRSEVPHHRHDG